MILVDGREDEKLRVFLSTVKDALKNVTDERECAKRLAELVGNRLGGDCDNIEAEVDKELARVGTKVVLIGELRAGFGCHRALLYKYCADRVSAPGLSCRQGLTLVHVRAQLEELLDTSMS